MKFPFYWIAFHEEYGYLLQSMCGIMPESCQEKLEIALSKDLPACDFIENLPTRGWQIRKVKLVHLTDNQ